MNELPDFDDCECLPKGCYKPSANQFKARFVDVNGSSSRKRIFNGYQNYCLRWISTGTVLKHWVNGSYITEKLDPGDIDLLVSFDGLKMDDDSTYNEIEDLSDDIKMKDEYECHTFCFAKYPPDLGILYKNYKDNIDTYIKIWKTDKHDCSDEKRID